MMPTLCVSSATSFSQLATSLSCADTFFGSFCNHRGDVDHGDGGGDDDDVDAVDDDDVDAVEDDDVDAVDNLH